MTISKENGGSCSNSNGGITSLREILDLAAKTLHNSGGEPRFSLEYLVPVHQTLLKQAFGNENHCQYESEISTKEEDDNTSTKSSLWFMDVLALDTAESDNSSTIAGDEDLILCRDILRGTPYYFSNNNKHNNNDSHVTGDNDRQELLVWQYLLQRARSSSSKPSPPSSSTSISMEWLSKVLFEHILPFSATYSNSTTRNAISKELMGIILELSLEWVLEEAKPSSNNHSDDPIMKQWNNLRARLLQSTQSCLDESHSDANRETTDSRMPLASRIVATLVHKYLETAQDATEGISFFLSVYYEHIWINLEHSCRHPQSSSGNQTSDANSSTLLLSEVSKSMLLPLLREFQNDSTIHHDERTLIYNRAHCHELDVLFHQRLLTLLEKHGVLNDAGDDESDEKQHLLLVATTILCPLLPWYWSQQQQQPSSTAWLWEFLYRCLQQGRRSVVQGRDCDKNSSSRGSPPRGGGNLSFCSGAGGLASMIRRRALYLLDIISSTSTSTKAENSSSASANTKIAIWKDYILCVETFEMVNERHLVDQIWPVVASLFLKAHANSESNEISSGEQQGSIPPLTLRWIELLVGRILSVEQLAVRKLGVFRLLQVLGRPMVPQTSEAQSPQNLPVAMDISPAKNQSHAIHNSNPSKKKKRESSKQQQSKKKRGKSAAHSHTTLEVLPTEKVLTSLSPQTILWDVLVPAWDSLSSVGYMIHLDNPKKASNNDGKPVEKFAKISMLPLFCQTIRNYTILASTSSPSSQSSLFWKGLWNWDRVICHLSAKTLLTVYRSVTELLAVEALVSNQESKSSEAATYSDVDPALKRKAIIKVVPMDDNDLEAIKHTYDRLFRNNLMVLSHRRQFLRMLSEVLSLAQLPSATKESTTTKNWNPINVISLLSLFSVEYFPALDSEYVSDWSIESEDMLVMLGAFVRRFESQSASNSHSVAVGAALASAFVTGQVSLTSQKDSFSVDWNPVDGSSRTDRELGWAITLFCTLAVSEKIRHTTGELLWPAIHKGLSQSPAVIISKGYHHPKASLVARALLLLEHGCQLRQLSGLGNGDLVVNPKTQQIMPPPPNIEQMLQNSVAFLQWHIRMLLATESHCQDEEGLNSSNNKNTKRFTGSYAYLISQLKILHQSYPSSQAVSSVMDELLQKSISDLTALLAGKEALSGQGDVKKLLLVALIYGACSCGAEPEKKSYISLIRLLLNTGLSTAGEGQPGVWVKSSRSIIQYARWASISCILPKLLETTSDNATTQAQDEIDQLVDDILDEGVRASSMTPSDAIKPLFDCIIISSREWIGISSKYDPEQTEILCVENLTRIVKTLLSLINNSTRSRESACMLNDFCALIFRTKLLREEYDRILKDPSSKCMTPIRDAFRYLIKKAGRYRPQITRAVLCRITVGWLGEEGCDSRGISAIPYREDIVKLLLHKEGKYDETSANQSMEELPKTGVTLVPSNTNYHSVTRAFLLVFFCKLPDLHAGLNSSVKENLLQYAILELMKQAAPEKKTHPSLVMRGTPTYCVKMRAWQALCILSRFVSTESALQVCTTVFEAMNELLHNQIRYFLENFTIKCATMHPSIFGEAFLRDICRTDLSLQHVSSLMIMGGNFILGRYQLDYFTQNKSRSKRVLAGVIPWLSSTQGFSRAIAQLIVYQLIPKVISIDNHGNSTTVDDNDWFLKSTYNFLDQNREMKRLRIKQTKFFHHYDCEAMCTPEGIFSIKLDEAEEADPLHLIDAIKESLRSTYDEAHVADAPSWKHVEESMVEDANMDSKHETSEDAINSTVQRKIIPLDSLNLALEDLREQRLSNARGTHKQNLIVCASLVDKVPNLAGLARTCEIFAAQSLVLPDLSVSKLDNFQSISVGAADWIDMEEVKEEALLSWLLQKKKEGFWIVGLEQTSSSVPLHQVGIPDFVASNNKTILLLGKEKEGIPVQFLQAVDTCVEIPQFGMIRSLNVHVSGAITIWELTRKTRLASLEEQQRQQNSTNDSFCN